MLSSSAQSVEVEWLEAKAGESPFSFPSMTKFCKLSCHRTMTSVPAWGKPGNLKLHDFRLFRSLFDFN